MNMSRLSSILICIYIACVAKHAFANIEQNDIELQLAQDQLATLQAQLNHYQNEHMAAQDAYHSMLQAQTDATTAWHSQQQTLADISAQIASLTAEVNNLDSLISQLNTELNELEDAKTQLEDMYGQCTSTDCGIFMRRGTCNLETLTCDCSYPWTGDNCETKSGCTTRRLLAQSTWTTCDGVCSTLSTPSEKEAYLMSQINDAESAHLATIQTKLMERDSKQATINDLQSDHTQLLEQSNSLTHQLQTLGADTETAMMDMDMKAEQMDMTTDQVESAQNQVDMYMSMIMNSCYDACAAGDLSNQEHIICAQRSFGCP